MTTHALCFRSLIEEIQTFGSNSEVDSLKKIFKMAVFHFFQQGTADVLLLWSKLDVS